MQARLIYPNVFAMHCMHDTDAGPWIFEQNLRGVRPVHAMDIVHRDLKPGQYFLPQRPAREDHGRQAGQVQVLSHCSLLETGLCTSLYVCPNRSSAKGRMRDPTSKYARWWASLRVSITPSTQPTVRLDKTAKWPHRTQMRRPTAFMPKSTQPGTQPSEDK